MDIMDIYQKWLSNRHLNSSLKRELMKIVGMRDEIEDRFYRTLDFGTAGIRGVMGAGTNRMNIYTVGAAARGFGEWILDKDKEKQGIIISYDSRNNSHEFALISARILGSMGINVLLSDQIRPVPMLSYGIRYYRCAGGIMITASHNPPEYNGFKAYGESGGQLMPDESSEVKTNIDCIEDIFEAVDNALSLDELISKGIINYIGDELDEAYDEEILSFFKDEEKDRSYRNKLKIVYTPLNGAGNIPVRRILSKLGFEQVFVVNEQENPDGNFSTMKVPNPELPDTFDLAIKTATAVFADIIIATDPDSDRLGIAARDSDGNYRVLKGNEIGIILMEYILTMKNSRNEIPSNGFCVTSIVSTKLTKKICKRYGIKLYQVFTGTKHIADRINELDEHGDEKFIFGFEESHGYMVDANIRDKDAISAAAIISEIAAFSKISNMTLLDQLDSIYSLYGYAADESYSMICTGENGQKQIKKAMEYYRNIAENNDGKLGEEGSRLGEIPVTRYRDFLPKSNVLMFEIGEYDFITMRPSGTEPKLKIYFGCYGKKNEARIRLAKISGMVLMDVNRVIDSSPIES